VTLLAFLPAAIALWIFMALLRQPDLPVTTQAEREAVASNSRELRPFARTVIVVAVVLPLIVVAALHLVEGGWMPVVLS
jgi:hypothetical protein